MNLSSSDIQLLVTLEPKEIVKWFKKKGYTISWNWQQVEKQAHAHTFTVAKVMKLDILKAIKEETDKIFTEGKTFQQYEKDLEPMLRKLGWWGKMKASEVPGYSKQKGVDPDKVVKLGSPRRLQTIYFTNANVGYATGRYKNQFANSRVRPYWQYLQVQRESKRKLHSVFHEKVFMYDDPIWDIIYPPNDWMCGCRINALNEAEMKAKGLKVSLGSDFKEEALKAVPEEWRYNPGKAAFNPNMNDYKEFL